MTRGIAAVLSAAAILVLPYAAFVLAGAESAVDALAAAGAVAVTVAVLATYVRSQEPPRLRAVGALVAGALLAYVLFALFVGSGIGENTCGDSALAGTAGWVGAGVLWFGGAAWGLHRPPRALAALPVSLVLALTWLFVASHALPGGTGPCSD